MGTQSVVSRLVLFIALLLGGISSGCAPTASLIDGETEKFSETWNRERDLGAENHQKILDEYREYEDTSLSEYVDSVGNVVLDHTGFRGPNAPANLRRSQFVFTVLDDEMVNAFALPGGYIYLTTGLLSMLNNEAQLAVVQDHEIGHVAGQHGVRRSNRALVTGAIAAGIAAASRLVTNDDETAETAGNAVSLGAGVTIAQYTKGHERESDSYAVRVAGAAGYDVRQGAGFFGTLERLLDMNFLQTFISTHPAPDNRAKKLRRADTADGRVGAKAYFAMVDGIESPYGDIDVMVAQKSMTMRDLLGSDYTDEQVREHLLLNQYQADQVIPAGTLVKVIK